jgi:hypothetical protein
MDGCHAAAQQTLYKENDRSGVHASDGEILGLRLDDFMGNAARCAPAGINASSEKMIAKRKQSAKAPAASTGSARRAVAITFPMILFDAALRVVHAKPRGGSD